MDSLSADGLFRRSRTKVRMVSAPMCPVSLHIFIDSMSIFFKSFLVGTGALIAAVSLILISVPLFGDTLEISMFINGIIGCYSIGSPVAYYCKKQTEKYKGALAREEELHKQLLEAHQQLKTRSRLDMMTGLLNRESFLTELESQKERNPDQTSSVILLDVDRFKRINDTWGHQAGDRALVLIAHTILEVVGSVTLAGRIGGEEFGVFLPHDDGSEAISLAEAIRIAVERIEFFPVPNLKEALSISIGVACASNMVPTDDVFQRADCMLYQAKADGRNCVCVFTTLSFPQEDGLPPLALQRRFDPQVL